MAVLELRTAQLAGLWNHDRMIVVVTAGGYRVKCDRFTDGHVERTATYSRPYVPRPPR